MDLGEKRVKVGRNGGLNQGDWLIVLGKWLIGELDEEARWLAKR